MDEHPTPWLDEEEMRAWRGLVEVYADVHAALTAELQEEFGFDEGDYGVLVNLSEAPDRRLRMCDLAERLHLSPSGLTRRLDGLVRLGLVAREPSAADRRVTLAELTDAGWTRLRAGLAAQEEVERALLVDFAPQDAEALVRLLGRLACAG